MRKLLLLITGILVVTVPALRAQQDPQFSMYMFNRQVINPAFVGTPFLNSPFYGEEGTNITGVGRSQWVGIEGAPNTFTLSAGTRSHLLRGGVGGVFSFDQIGPFSTMNIRGNYAFRIPVGENGAAFQVGLGLGFIRTQIDGTNWRPVDQNDPLLRSATVNSTGNLDVGAGVTFFLPNDKLFVGIGSDHLTEPSLAGALPTIDGNGSESKISRHFNLLAGYKFDISSNIAFQPSTMVKLAGTQRQVDINANFLVSPMVFGISYRLQDALVGVLGFNATKNLFVAYSYDYTLSQLNVATSGSHELVISYTIPKAYRFRPPDPGVRNKPVIR